MLVTLRVESPKRIEQGDEAVAILKDGRLVQLTDDGLTVELTAKEMKYHKDDHLN